MKTRVLVLGTTGMLGSMVYRVLGKNPEFEVFGTARVVKRSRTELEFDALEFIRAESQSKFLKDFDYIINCIGIIKPYCKDDDPVGVLNAITVNSLFPHKLANFLSSTPTKIIQIATDCVYSGKPGDYDEDAPHDPLDVYGKTKSLGEVFVGSFLNIRCSIIGPEIEHKSSLLEWFLKQEKGTQLQGFSHHRWNGVTTLQFAQLCEEIIKNEKFTDLLKFSHTYHFVPNTTVTKYELLKIFNQAFDRDYKIKRVSDVGEPVDRTLSTKFTALNGLFEEKTMEKAVRELANYMREVKISPYV